MHISKGKEFMKVFQAKKLSRIIKETFGKDQSDDSSEFKSLSSFSNMSSPRINRRSSSKLQLKAGVADFEEIEKEKFDNGVFEAVF